MRALASMLAAVAVLVAAPARAEDACGELAQRERLHPSASALYDLASCHQEQRRTATAWAELREVAARAHAEGDAAREELARDRAASIEPFLSRLAIVVRRPAAGLVVERDGVAITPNQMGTAFAIDPGEHTIVARAPGREAWSVKVSVPADGKVITVAVPELPIAHAHVHAHDHEHGGMRPAAGAFAPRTVPAAERYEVTRDTGQRVAGVVVALVGFGGVAAGTAFELDSIFRRDRSSSHCDAAGKCDAEGSALRDDARRETNLGVAAIVAGGALMVGGVLLYANAPTRVVRVARRVDLAPMVGAGTTGVVVRGTF